MTGSTDVKEEIAKSMSAVDDRRRKRGRPRKSYGGAQVARENPCADLPPTQLSPFRDKK